MAFLIPITLYPRVQKKAQTELDRVLAGHLPEFNDGPNLPYIAEPVVKGPQRWQLVLPLGTSVMPQARHRCLYSNLYFTTSA
jgi:hypothetical protein